MLACLRCENHCWRGKSPQNTTCKKSSCDSQNFTPNPADRQSPSQSPNPRDLSAIRLAETASSGSEQGTNSLRPNPRINASTHLLIHAYTQKFCNFLHKFCNVMYKFCNVMYKFCNVLRKFLRKFGKVLQHFATFGNFSKNKPPIFSPKMTIHSHHPERSRRTLPQNRLPILTTTPKFRQKPLN